MSDFSGSGPGDNNEWLEELSRNYSSYRERLVNGLCRKFRSFRLQRHEAEIVADEALSKARANIAKYNPATRPLYVWVHMIATRCAWDRIRSAERRRASVSVDDPATEKLLLLCQGPADIYQQRKTAAIVQEEIARLPKLQGDALRLCRLERMPQDEAAKQLGVEIRQLQDALYKGGAALRANRAIRIQHYGCDYAPKSRRTRKGRTGGHE